MNKRKEVVNEAKEIEDEEDMEVESKNIDEIFDSITDALKGEDVVEELIKVADSINMEKLFKNVLKIDGANNEIINCYADIDYISFLGPIKMLSKLSGDTAIIMKNNYIAWERVRETSLVRARICQFNSSVNGGQPFSIGITFPGSITKMKGIYDIIYKAIIKAIPEGKTPVNPLNSGTKEEFELKEGKSKVFLVADVYSYIQRFIKRFNELFRELNDEEEDDDDEIIIDGENFKLSKFEFTLYAIGQKQLIYSNNEEEQKLSSEWKMKSKRLFSTVMCEVVDISNVKKVFVDLAFNYSPKNENYKIFTSNLGNQKLKKHQKFDNYGLGFIGGSSFPATAGKNTATGVECNSYTNNLSEKITARAIKQYDNTKRLHISDGKNSIFSKENYEQPEKLIKKLKELQVIVNKMKNINSSVRVEITYSNFRRKEVIKPLLVLKAIDKAIKKELWPHLASCFVGSKEKFFNMISAQLNFVVKEINSAAETGYFSVYQQYILFYTKLWFRGRLREQRRTLIENFEEFYKGKLLLPLGENDGRIEELEKVNIRSCFSQNHQLKIMFEIKDSIIKISNELEEKMKRMEETAEKEEEEENVVEKRKLKQKKDKLIHGIKYVNFKTGELLAKAFKIVENIKIVRGKLGLKVNNVIKKYIGDAQFLCQIKEVFESEGQFTNERIKVLKKIGFNVEKESETQDVFGVMMILMTLYKTRAKRDDGAYDIMYKISRVIEKIIKKQKLKNLHDVEVVLNDIYKGFLYVTFQNGSPCYSLKVKQSALLRPNEILVNGKIWCRLTISKSSYLMKLTQYNSYLARLVPGKSRGKKILDDLLCKTVKNESFKKCGNTFVYEPKKTVDRSMKEIEDSEELKNLGNRRINLEKRLINIEQEDETEEVIEEEEEITEEENENDVEVTGANDDEMNQNINAEEKEKEENDNIEEKEEKENENDEEKEEEENENNHSGEDIGSNEEESGKSEQDEEEAIKFVLHDKAKKNVRFVEEDECVTSEEIVEKVTKTKEKLSTSKSINKSKTFQRGKGKGKGRRRGRTSKSVSINITKGIRTTTVVTRSKTKKTILQNDLI